MKNTKQLESIILEIKCAEGGDDSKLLVKDMSDIYIKSAKINNFSWEITSQRDGMTNI